MIMNRKNMVLLLLLVAGGGLYMAASGAGASAGKDAVQDLLVVPDGTGGMPRPPYRNGELAVRYGGQSSLQNTVHILDRTRLLYATRNGLRFEPGEKKVFRWAGPDAALFVAEPAFPAGGLRFRIRSEGRLRTSGLFLGSVQLGPNDTVELLSGISAGWLYSPRFVPSGRQPRLILHVVIDAMRRDALAAAGGSPRIAPHLNRLAREATFFSAAYTPSNWTRPATTAFFTGLYPWQSRIPTTVFGLAAADQRTFHALRATTLPLTLRRAGWYAAAVVNNVFMVGTTPLGLDFGFNRILDIRSDGPDTAWITQEAIRTIDRHQGAPLYLFLNYNAPHGPYTPPPLFLHQVAGLQPDHYRRYMGEVAFSDAALGEVLAHLRRRGLYEEALIMVHSDHGEILEDTHSRAAFFPYMLRHTHGETAYRQEIAVPLLVKYPASRREFGPRTNAAPFSLAALPALLMQATEPGVVNPFPDNKAFQDNGGFLYFEGRCLEAVTDGRLVYSRRFPGVDRVQYRLGGQRYSCPEEVYDLRQDPRELTNLAALSPDLTARLRQVLTNHPLRLRPGQIRFVFPGRAHWRVTIRLASGNIHSLPRDARCITVNSNTLTFELTPRSAARVTVGLYPPRFQGEVEISRNGVPERPLLGPGGIALFRERIRIGGRMDLFLQGEPVQPAAGRVQLWFDGLAAGGTAAAGSTVSGQMRDMLKSWGYIQ